MTVKLKKIAIISTSPFILKFFFKNHVDYLAKKYKVDVYTNLKNFSAINLENYPAKVLNLGISREINLLEDILCLFKLILIFLFCRYDLVISLGPKAGLLGTLASFITRTKKRLFIFQGEVWATKTGFYRFFLKSIDQSIVLLSTCVLAVNHKEKIFLENEGVDKYGKIKVLGYGSIGGVNTSPSLFLPNDRIKFLKKLNFSSESIIMLYMGRVNKEKGLVDLVQAFKGNINFWPKLNLIIVGPDEAKTINFLCKILGKYKSRVRFLGYQSDPSLFFYIADFVILPSYREGLPQTILEAFAYKKPVISTKIYGVEGVVIDRFNGILVKPGDIPGISLAINFLYKNPAKIKLYGENAYKFVKEKFNKKKVMSLYEKYFDRLLK